MSFLKKIKDSASGKKNNAVSPVSPSTPKAIDLPLSKEPSSPKIDLPSPTTLKQKDPLSPPSTAAAMELDSRPLSNMAAALGNISTHDHSYTQQHAFASNTALSSSAAAPAAASSRASSRPKYSLADFHINRTLGTGSFGRVHLVQLKSSGKFYAMKVLKKTEIVKMRQVEHTINERAILDQLDFPFLVHMLGTFQDCSNLYFVMEYVQGGELFSFLRRCGRFQNHVARFYAAEVILAFEYLHNKDIVYRDLKPENLLIDAQGHIKITDFGFAKYIPDNISFTLCGTPDYLAPEIIQSKAYGKAVDWWALGVLIYEMLAGHPPFYDEDHFKLYEKILACKPRFPAHFDPHAKDLVKRLLTADLTKRYGNLRGGIEDIKRHKWFTGVDWDRVRSVGYTAPYVPPVKGEGDTSNFDTYPEDHEPYGVICPDPHRDKFRDF